MKRILFATCIIVFVNTSYAQQAKKAYTSFADLENLMQEVKPHREQRLVTLQDFIKKSKQKNTLILDTRSKEMYDRKHLTGAININFSDFTQQVLDDFFSNYNGKNTQILIYCNNNFEDQLAPNLQDLAFMTKAILPQEKTEKLKKNLKLKQHPKTLALNIPTYINLYGYGYKNVYELAELVDVNDDRISFEGTDVISKSVSIVNK